MKNYLSALIAVLMVSGLTSPLCASDKTIWGEQTVVNSAQSPASKGQGSGTPQASRRMNTRTGLAQKNPSHTGRYAARRGDNVSTKKYTAQPTKKTNAPAKHHDTKPAKSKKGAIAADAVISTQAQLDTLIAKHNAVVVKVFIQGCVPCVAMRPVVAELATRLGDQVAFVNIDATQKNFLNVKAYPTLIGYKGGKEQFRLIGEHSVEQLKAEISRKLLK